MRTVMYSSKKMGLYGLVIWLGLIPCGLRAQAGGGDSLSALRAFINISSIYQQLPMQAEIHLQKTTDFVTAGEDTAGAVIRFCFRKEAAYVQYGGLEQLVNDSLMLIVNNDARRMIVQTNNQPVAERVRQYTNLLLPDSSLHKIAQLFRATITEKNKDGITVINLESRAHVYAGSLPVQTISLQYRDNKEPIAIIQTKRSLLPIAADRYQLLVKDSAWNNRLVTAPDGKHFFVRREQVATYRYQKIDHKEEGPMPVQIADRISRDETGKYVPVKAYREFILTQNR